MQIYLVRKSKNICFTIIPAWIILSSLENFFRVDFFLVWRILSTKNFIQSRESYRLRILSSLENFIYSRDVYLVYKTLFSIVSLEIFLQYGDFYPVQWLLPRVENFIQCGEIYSVQRFYLVQRLLFSEEIFIQCGDFYPMRTL